MKNVQDIYKEYIKGKIYPVLALLANTCLRNVKTRIIMQF